MPTLDILDVICGISYNYCCVYVLSEQAAFDQRNVCTGCEKGASSCHDWHLDDVIVFLSETCELLLRIKVD